MGLSEIHSLTSLVSLCAAAIDFGRNRGLGRKSSLRRCSHDKVRTPLFTPLRNEGSFGVLSGALSSDKWARGEIPKYIVARRLLCDEPSRICRATSPRAAADAKTDRWNPGNGASLHGPSLTRRNRRRTGRKFGSWRRVFLLGKPLGDVPADQAQKRVEERGHNEPSRFSSGRSATRLCRGE